MNAKYIVALVLALQVSLSLCEAPTPSQELLEKYHSMKAIFYKRLLHTYARMQAAAAPLVEKIGEDEHGQAARTYIEDLQAKPEFQAFVKIVAGLGEEAVPLVDKARTSVLGAYEEFLRPHIGVYLNDAINNIKVVLDKVMPAE